MAIFQHFPFGPALKSCLNKLKFLGGFTKSKKKHMLKISAVYLIGKAKIPIHYTTWAEVEQTLYQLVSSRRAFSLVFIQTNLENYEIHQVTF